MIGYDKPALWKYDVSVGLWTWMNGDTVANAAPVFGVQGIPSPFNTPGSRAEQGNCWTDNNGNLWLFGGWVYGNYYSDTWKYDIGTNEWTWMKGPNIPTQPDVYGIKGVPNILNNPGSRGVHCKWKDSNGDLWMFGGSGNGFYNDLWRFNPAANLFTWIGGTSIINDGGNYGPLCIADSTYLPGARFENRSCWNDACDNFWMYGGAGIGAINDLWHYSPVTNAWTLLSGSNSSSGINTVFGTLGVPSVTNNPGTRNGTVSWTDSLGNLWMMGGSTSFGFANDIWKFTLDPSCITLNSCSLAPFVSLQSSDTSFCGKKCLDFTDLSTNNPTSWQWFFPGADSTTSNLQNPTNICYSSFGSFDVTLIACNANGCDSLTLTNFINEYPNPPVPVITGSFDTLFCSPAFAYQWYDVSGIIPGATGSYYVYQQQGNYFVIVTDSNGCASSSAVIYTGIEEAIASGQPIKIIPNPSSGNVELVYNSTEGVFSMLKIVDVTGRTVFSTDSEIGSHKINLEVNDGIYFIALLTSKTNYYQKFIVKK